jgi:hypothetical protein
MSLYRTVVAGFLGMAMIAAAQTPQAELRFPRSVTEKAGPENSIETRPNIKQPFVVLVKNLTEQERTFTVELEIPADARTKGSKAVKMTSTVTLGAQKSTNVTFTAPPPPKKEEPPKTPAEAKKEAEAALKPEPPAGIPVPISIVGNRREFVFIVRVKNAMNESALGSTKERTVSITVQHPSRYLSEPDVTLQGTGSRRDLVAIVGAPPRKTDATPDLVEQDFEPSVDVRFEFPPQIGLKVANLPEGSYRRPISKTGQQVTLRAENLPYQGTPDVPVKYHFTVDGYPRAFNYSSNVRRAIDLLDTAANKEKRLRTSAVRLYPVGTTTKIRTLEALVTSGTDAVPRIATLPTTDLRFRVETDNEADNSSLQLRIARAGKLVRPTVDLDPDEIIDLGLPKEQRVWLDPAGPDGALFVANTTADHVASVDVSALRGLHELQAVLVEPDPLGGGVPKETKTSYYVVVDETPPPADDIRIAPFPKRLERGKPLPVFVTASDPETFIDKVSVVVGRPGPDGKIIPPDALVVDAVETALGWVAQVPLPVPAPVPPPPPGAPPVAKVPVPPIDITVVATNEVGLSTAKVVRIELVEPLGATLEISVLRGGRPQPDTPVVLIDGEGKQKGAGKTDKKGVIVFTNLPPGVYKATALKEDSSYGLAGYAATTIPDPPPPPTKPIPLIMDLRKRR